MFAQGPARAASHRLIFENSPENWQAGFPIGNGDFGGLVFQPPESLVEIAFTRLDNWHHNLTSWQRLTLDELRKISAENPDTLPGLLAKERRCGDEPIFKPGGRLRIWQEEFGGTAGPTLFDRRQELDLEHGEVVGSSELSLKAVERTTFAADDCDVIVTRVKDTYLHELQAGTYLSYTQRIELYRLYDPQCQILDSGVTDEGIGYIRFNFGEELQTIIAFKTGGLPWHTPVVTPSSVSLELVLDYVHEPNAKEYTVYQTMIVCPQPDDKTDLLNQAREVLARAEKRGFDDLQDKNRAFWQNFWQTCGITLGNPALEALWYNNLYQYGSQSRGKVAPALFGLWNADRSAPWAGRYAGDINVAMYAWPLAGLNHPEMLNGLFNTIEGWLPALRKETVKTYGVDALHFPVSCGLRGEDATPSMYRLMACAGGFYMDYYRKMAAYYPDKKVLQERIYPVMLATARFYIALAVENPDGSIAFGPSWAPEQGAIPAWNAANDLGLIKPLWQAVLQMEKVLNITSPDGEKIAELLNKFPDYPQADGEFIDSASEKGRTELCHPGYLACIVPGDDVDADSDLADVARQTLRGHLSHTCRKPLAGKIGSGCDLTWGWMLAAAIRLRDREFAETVLMDIGISDFLKSNGMFACIGGRQLNSIAEKRRAYDVPATQAHTQMWQTGCLAARNYTMTMPQQSGAFLFALMECLLQSHKNQIKLFPCVLDCLGESVSFDNLRTEGGLNVAAAWSQGEITYFRIECGAEPYNGTLRLFEAAARPSLMLNNNTCLPAVEPGIFELDLIPGAVISYGKEPTAELHTAQIKSFRAEDPAEYGRRGTFY